MNNTLLSKILAVSIILLLIGVSVSSAISVDTESTISNNQNEECKECQEISKSDLVKVERLLNRVEVYSKLLLVLSKYNPELRDVSEELSNEITNLKEELTNNYPFPIICGIIVYLFFRLDNLTGYLYNYSWYLCESGYSILSSLISSFADICYLNAIIIGEIGLSLNCDFTLISIE